MNIQTRKIKFLDKDQDCVLEHETGSDAALELSQDILELLPQDCEAHVYDEHNQFLWSLKL